jgi:hypothetical protein
LIRPIGLPEDSKVPDPTSGVSTSEEYDIYFRIVRENPDLLAWTRTCLDIQKAQIEELDHTSFSQEEKYELLRGLTVVYGITLERWARIGEALKRDGD